MKIETKMVSPAMAEAILESNPNNRPVSYPRVEQLATAMRNGKWQKNGETIIISKTGRLLDGQHRLYAIREYGAPVEMILVQDVDDNAFETIDTGRTRTAIDIARIQGKTVSPSAAGAAGTLWRIWHNTRTSEPCPPYAVLRILERYPSISKWAHHHSADKQARIAPGASLVTALTYLEDIKKEPIAADRFFKAIARGVNLQEGDPLLTLRNRMITMRGEQRIMNIPTTWTLFARTITALENGEQLFRLQADHNRGTLLRPQCWDEHVNALPKRQRLDDLHAPPPVNVRKRDLFNEMVKEHRDRAADNIKKRSA